MELSDGPVPGIGAGHPLHQTHEAAPHGLDAVGTDGRGWVERSGAGGSLALGAELSAEEEEWNSLLFSLVSLGWERWGKVS